MEESIQSIIERADSIVVVQPDNPDGDSLASSLALEQILGDMGKEVHLYCGVAIPTYLRYLPGWDRVQDLLPVKFDASIIVDTVSKSLLEQLSKSNSMGWLKAKPCIVFDHHADTEPDIDFATVVHLEPAVSTGELIYEVARKLNWPLNSEANNMIMTSIMSDSLGLTSEGTSSRSIQIVAALVERGVSIPALENARRAMQRKSPEILKYKGRLLQRVEYNSDGNIAMIDIPWEEIEQYSAEYNPSMLVLDEMRLVENVELAVAFKSYPDGRVTAKLRANYGSGVAAEVARHFGGGGHPYASGFKVTEGRSLQEVKSETLKIASQLLADKLKVNTNETY